MYSLRYFLIVLPFEAATQTQTQTPHTTLEPIVICGNDITKCNHIYKYHALTHVAR